MRVPRNTAGTVAAIYTRLSLDREGTKESPERQEASCRQFCAQKGWEVADVYCDRDVSAYSGRRRPAFERMLADVASGLVGAVVTFKLDRLTRGGLTGVARVLMTLNEAGAILASVTEPVDTSSAMGEGMLGLLASQAKQESQNTSLRVRVAHADAAARGRPHGGPRCFGYRRDNTIDPDEAAVIRELVERVCAGSSLRSLAFDLNARGVRTSQGKQWSGPALGQMLRSPKLRGCRIHNGECHAGTWEPVLSESEHLALLEILDDPRRLSARRSMTRHLLTGVAVCGLCGGRLKYMVMTNRNGSRFPRYQCVKAPGVVNCGRVAASMAALDGHVTRRLLAAIADGSHEGAQDVDHDDDSREHISALLADDHRAMEELTQARFFHRSIGDAEYTVTRTALEERISATEAELSRLDRDPEAVDVPRTHGELTAWWDSAAVVDHRKVLAVNVERVILHPAHHRGGNRFDPNRVEIVWR